jgi:hypothetical protein
VTAPSPKEAFAGTWEITWAEVWLKDALDLIQPAFIRFESTIDSDQGEFAMIAMRGGLDCLYGHRDGSPSVEFSWQGDDDGEERCGRGWAVLEGAAKLRGRLFIHCGDDSEFVAERTPRVEAKSRRSGKQRRPSVR